MFQIRIMKGHWEKLCECAEREIELLLEQLPPDLRLRARKLPILFERSPSEELQAEGIAQDTLGIFAGAELADEGVDIMPPQIILFLENINDFAENDADRFVAEVRTTYLHELGHFLGLDEGDLSNRGLD